jgi:hypothetical protein
MRILWGVAGLEAVSGNCFDFCSHLKFEKMQRPLKDHHKAATAAAGRRHVKPTQNETKANPLEGLWALACCGDMSEEECGQLGPLGNPEETTATATLERTEIDLAKPAANQTQLLMVKIPNPPLVMF